MKHKWLYIVIAVAAVPALMAASSIMNVGSRGADGNLEFFDNATGTTIMTIKDGTDGVTFGQPVSAAAITATSVVSSGSITGLASVVDYTTSATARTVTAAESGTVFTLGTAANGAVTFNLPTAASGLTYTFIDLDVTAGVDLRIQAAAGDTINGGTAAKIYECTGDAVKQSVTIVAVDGVKWEVISELGTWANNNS